MTSETLVDKIVKVSVLIVTLLFVGSCEDSTTAPT